MATVTTQVHKVEKIVEVDEKFTVLTLSPQEVMVLRAILGRVGGVASSNGTTPRDHSNAMYYALDDANDEDEPETIICDAGFRSHIRLKDSF